MFQYPLISFENYIALISWTSNISVSVERAFAIPAISASDMLINPSTIFFYMGDIVAE
jgi:hypothetical protein